MKLNQCFYWIGLCLLLSASMQAQLGLERLSIDSLNSLGYDPLVRVYDIAGQEYSPFEVLVSNTSTASLNVVSGPHVTTCNAGMFELYFEDVANNTGSGFDNLDPVTPTTTFPTVTTLGGMRQQALCQALSDLSTFLGQAPGTSITTTVRIKIPVSGNFNGSKTGEGSSYYVVPRGTTASMLDGEVWKTINLGSDSWATMPPNIFLSIFLVPTNTTGDFFHGYLKFYFRDNTSNIPLYHYDYTTPNTNTTLADFYSLALHESIHTLGFASLFDGIGLSRMRSTGFSPGCTECYTRYDGYLNSRNAGPTTELLDDTNPLNPSLQITGSVIQTLAPTCNSPFADPVFYNGLNHLNQEVYSPSPFEVGSSLAHFSCDCPTSSGYVGAMMACSQIGTDQRFLNQAEVNTLCDLGYQRGNSWTINGTTVANYASCTNTPCLAIGSNDYQDANGIQYTAVVDASGPVPLAITNVLDNDLFPRGSTPSILNHNVEILNGGGTVMVSGTSITYTPSTTFAGWAILAYVPACLGNLMNGNPTYIFIKVSPEPAPCNDFNCNLICGGNLEKDRIPFHRDAVSFLGGNNVTFHTLTGSGTVAINISPFAGLNFTSNLSPNGTIPGTTTWGTGCSNVHIDGLAPNSTAPFSSNNRTFIKVASTNIQGAINRLGIKLNLVSPLVSTEPYTLTFWAIADPAINCLRPEVHIYGANVNTACNNPIPLNNTLGGIATGNGCTTQLIGKSIPIPTYPNNANNAQEWHQYTVTIDPVNRAIGSAYDLLYITLQNVVPGTQSSLFLDEFELYGDNTVGVNINTTTNNPYPCISNQGGMDAFTIDYEVCLDDSLQMTNANDIRLQVDLNGFTVLGGDFNNVGELSIPAGSQTTACATYSITLTAPVPNNILPGVAINFPVTLTSIGASCITNTASVLEVDITPVQTLPLGITTSVSGGSHIVGSTVTYTIEVCNSLPLPLNNLKVRDFLNPGELAFDAAASPNFTHRNTGGNVLLQTAYFNLPAAIGPLSPSCTTFTFTAEILTGARNCAARRPIPNQASVQQRLSNCQEVVSNTVTIFPTRDIVIPTTVRTLSQAIAGGFLLPQNVSANTAQRVAIEGSLLMDVGSGSSSSSQNYTFATGSEIIMYPGAEMVIPIEQLVTFRETHVHGCNEMWHRILVQDGGAIKVEENSLFEQAEYAIEFENNSVYRLSESTFRDNYVSLYAAPSAQAKTTRGRLSNLTFEGTGGANFLPPYAGQTTVPDTWPFAGIAFHDVIALNLPKFSGNVFQRLSIGIIAKQTNLTIRQGATFNNLRTVNSYSINPPTNINVFINTNIGILMESAANPSRLVEDGFGGMATSQITFDDCIHGIVIIGNVDFEVTNNRMDLTSDIDAGGILCFGARGRTGLIENNHIKSSQGGIFLSQNDAPNTNLEVIHNEITLSEGGFLGGISLLENGITYTPVIENNTINLFDARNGIWSLNQSGALIRGNQINLMNDVIGTPISLGFVGYSNRTGIFTGGSNNQVFTCNRIQGGGPGTLSPLGAYDLTLLGINNQNHNVFGIRAGQSSNNAYECNQFDLLPNGIQISGMPSTSDLRGNVFNRVGRGLWVANGSQIGTQSHAGNRWAWSAVASLTGVISPAQINAMGVAGAQNDAGSLFGLQGSRFLFDASANSDFRPFSIRRIFPNIPNAWFTPFPDNGLSFDCNNTNTCNIPIPLALANGNGTNNLSILSLVEQSAVLNTLAPTIFPQTTIFETNKATYTKLKEDQSFALSGSAAAAFVQQKAQECEGKMYAIAQQCSDLNVLPPSIQRQVHQRQAQIELGLIEVYRLDSLSLKDTVHIDSLQSMAMLERQGIASVMNQQAQVFAQQQQLKITSADAIATQNAAITVQYTAEQNLQEVNAIYLATIAKGIFGFNVDQIQSLDVIARQCPLEGGIAVYKARSMVTFFTKVNYEALGACGTTERFTEMEHQTTDIDILNLLLPQEIKLYPNPTSTYLMVEWDFKFIESGECMLYNSLGQKVLQVALDREERTQEVSLPNLPTGMYICRLRFDNKAVHEEKIIIEQR